MTKRFAFVLGGWLLLTSITAHAQNNVDFRQSIERSSPATVAVLLPEDPSGPGGPSLPGGFGFRSSLSPPAWSQSSRPIRSGFAVAADLVITANIPSDLTQLRLRTGDGEELTGAVVVRDHVTGLAAVRISGTTVNASKLAAAAPQAGLPVYVSALRDGRTLSHHRAMIATAPNSSASELGLTQQLDVTFPPEFHGAAVRDVDGSVVAALAADDQDQLVCLAISQITRVIQTATSQDPTDLNPGRIGVRFGGSTDAVISGVVEGTPAQAAGLRVGDIITKLDDHVCADYADVMAAVAMARGGDEVVLTIQRGEETLEKSIQLATVEPPPAPQRSRPIVPRRAYQLKDGKLVPIAPEQVQRWNLQGPDWGDQDLVLPLDPTIELNLPGGNWVGNLQVERSKLEQAIKQLEAEKAAQDKKIEALSEQLSQLRSAAKPKLAPQVDLEQLKQSLDEIRQKLEAQEPR